MTATTTTPHVLSRSLLDEVIDVAASTFGTSIDVREDYSGRGMDGRTCFGLTIGRNEEREVFAALGYLAGLTEGREDDADIDLMELARYARTDSMGRDTIVYFPGWELD